MGRDFSYKDEVKMFNSALKDANQTLMPSEEDEEQLCNLLKEIAIMPYIGKKIDDSRITNLFLGSLDILGPKTQDLYNEVTPNIKLVRDLSLDNNEALVVGNPFNQQIILTSKPLYTCDFAAFAHEMGHIPALKKPHKNEYYEYSEVFPMILEYLACRQIDEKMAMEIFLNIRLAIIQAEAIYYLSLENEKKGNRSYRDKFLECEKKEHYKYIKSLELALRLIERLNESQKEVATELDKYATSQKSLRDIATSLDIDTSGCKKLLKVASKKIIII